MEHIAAAIINAHTEVQIDSVEDLDIRTVGEDKYHLIHDGRSYNIEVTSLRTAATKSVVCTINGVRYEIQLRDQLDLKLQEMGFASQQDDEAQDIVAPMPGKVLQVLVNDGDQVKAGDSVLILEAMKMENVIKAHDVATIQTVEVEVGQSVQKGDVLVTFDHSE